MIARFFKEIGRADELGSGVRNLYNYTRIYSGGADPQLLEGDIFKIIVPVTPQVTPQATPQATPQVTPQATPQVTPQATPQVTPQATSGNEANKIAALLEYCIEPRSRVEIQEFMGLKDREYFRLEILNPLIREGKLFLSIPDKPNSPNQKYYSYLKDPNHV